MWVTQQGGFDTYASPDPIAHFGEGLRHFLETADEGSLSEFSEVAASESERVFLELKALRLPPDSDPEFRYAALPTNVQIDLNEYDDLEHSLATELDKISIRWRLDAVTALEEGIYMVMERRFGGSSV